MGRKPKPTIVHVDCPCCQAELKVSIWKQRIGEPSPVEYDISASVEALTQGRLFAGEPADPDAAGQAVAEEGALDG